MQAHRLTIEQTSIIERFDEPMRLPPRRHDSAEQPLVTRRIRRRGTLPRRAKNDGQRTPHIVGDRGENARALVAKPLLAPNGVFRLDLPTAPVRDERSEHIVSDDSG